jgi:polysaccharide biosynthesis/export protein
MKRSCILCALTSALISLLAPALVRADSTYRVGPEDVLKVQVARHEEMGGEVVVLSDGTVMLPVVGGLSVVGLSVEQIRDQVAHGLRKKLVSPEVTVEVLRPRPRRVFVSGDVKMPQPLDLKEGWRITEALANAGGLVVRPEVARGTLFRLPDQTLTLDLARIYVDQDPTANLPLQPGDVIDIQEAPTVRIFVTGQVQRSGVIDLTQGRGVVEALALAGGALPTAALSKAYVVKKDGRKLYVNLARLINHSDSGEQPADHAGQTPDTAVSTDLTLAPGDELVVPENLAKIVVWGMVNHPQFYPLEDGEVTTLAGAIALSGGFDKRAAKSQIGILRLVNGKQTLVKVDMNRFVKGQELNPPLQDRDIVYVPETRTPDWTGKILPSLSGLAATWFYLKP